MKTKEPKTEKVKEIKEKKVKAPKEPKAKKAKKQMPEGYIGRPKPMKTKKFEFHKPTTGFYIRLGIWAVVIAFVVYLGIRLATVQTTNLTNVVRYDFKAEGQPESYVLENSKLKNEISYLKGELEKTDYEIKASELDRAIKLANDVNTDKPLSDEIEAEINALSSYFTDEEVDCMRIKRGTLTASERQIMEDHVVVTKKILDKVYFNRNYAKAPKWAAEHHECVDGSGYPNKIAGESLCIESRILAVADITDALLATDRPYKKPIPKDKACMIMKDMAKSGKLDPKLVGYMEQCLK